jgi:hypothetical protein
MIEHVKAVKELDGIRIKILKSENRSEIGELVEKAICIGWFTPIKKTGPLAGTTYYAESRKRAIEILTMDKRAVLDNSYPDLETIHFQTVLSICSLSLSMINGGISELNRIVAN